MEFLYRNQWVASMFMRLTFGNMMDLKKEP